MHEHIVSTFEIENYIIVTILLSLRGISILCIASFSGRIKFHQPVLQMGSFMWTLSFSSWGMSPISPIIKYIEVYRKCPSL